MNRVFNDPVAGLVAVCVFSVLALIIIVFGGDDGSGPSERHG